MGVGAARCYPPDPAVLAAARLYAADRLRDLELEELRDDVQLLLTELITNVIIHARTPFEVRVDRSRDGVQVEVIDGNPAMPVPGMLAANAMSGRGLTLVQSLAARWGAHPNEDAGKTVWFEIVPNAVESPAAADLAALLAMWDDRADDLPSNNRVQAEVVEVVIPELPVQRLLAAKAHMEDLLREVQFVLLGSSQPSTAVAEWDRLVEIARGLDAAAGEFAEGRRQVRLHALEAAARGEEVVTLRLHLPPEAAGPAARYGEAVRRAEELGSAGDLFVTAEHLTEYADIRRRYLDAVIEQLTAYRPAD